MKLEIEVNFDFGRLANELPNILKKYTERYAVSSEKGSKENIDKGVSPKLKPATLARRKRRGTGGSKPLFETGALYRSIKGTSEGLTLNRYGWYHHSGDLKAGTPTRPFIAFSKKEIKPVFDKFKQDIRKALHNSG